MPAASRARDGLLRFLARRIDHADQAQKDEFLLDALVNFVRCSNASDGSVARGNAQRAQRLAGELFVRLQNLARGAASVNGRLSSPTSSCEQRASSTSGAPLVKTSSSLLSLGIGVNRAHQLALGRERDFSDALEARVERLVVQSGFARRDEERAFGRIALHRPAPVVLLQHGVVRAVGDGQRALQFDAQSVRRVRRHLRTCTSPSGA